MTAATPGKRASPRRSLPHDLPRAVGTVATEVATAGGGVRGHSRTWRPGIRSAGRRLLRAARHYHTLEHLAEMFAVVDRLSAACTDLRAVEFAVWFHDAVYDPRTKD